MKRITLLVVFITAISFKGNTQHFIASFGIESSWDIPVHVSHVVHDNYYGYEWVHATRVVRRGSLFFEVLLQRGDVFVEVHIGPRGHVYRTRHWDYYPFHDHVCSHRCGYHPVYYRTYYTTCRSHHHHGHNHVVYRKNIHVQKNVQVHNHHKTVVVNKHHHTNSSSRVSRSTAPRVNQGRSQRHAHPQRRTTYHATQQNKRSRSQPVNVERRRSRQSYSAGSSRRSTAPSRSRSDQSSVKRRSY